MDEITKLKDKLLEHARKGVEERGADRIDPEIYDAIKDLSEAAYYCKVTEQMGQEPMGYQRYGYAPMGYMPMGYDQMGYMGYQARDSRGRYMGYGDSVEAVRNILASASPEEKERIKAEMRSM